MNFATFLIRKMYMDQASPRETFRVLKEKKEKQYGQYRTRRLLWEVHE
jgi:hypothetical protein